MPPRLRLKRDAKGAVGVDVDRPDRVHLQGYLERHHSLRLGPRGVMTQGAERCNSGEGVFHRLRSAQAVDQCKVDPDIGQQSAVPGQEFVDRRKIRAIWAGEIWEAAMSCVLLCLTSTNTMTSPSRPIRSISPPLPRQFGRRSECRGLHNAGQPKLRPRGRRGSSANPARRLRAYAGLEAKSKGIWTYPWLRSSAIR
jgi:hypothetical protein